MPVADDCVSSGSGAADDAYGDNAIVASRLDGRRVDDRLRPRRASQAANPEPLLRPLRASHLRRAL
jgi:hypothetical protein